MTTKLTYRHFLNPDSQSAEEIDVAASPEEISHFAEKGYLVREGVFSQSAVAELHQALADLSAKEPVPELVGKDNAFGGQFLRYIHEKHPAFMDLLRMPELITPCKAMLGPHIRLRGLTARIIRPGEVDQQTIWHQHLRQNLDPAPPWFNEADGIDILIYLDDVTEENGPLCVISSSFRQAEFDGDVREEHLDQTELLPSAGTAVMIHSNLWHRSKPTINNDKFRRLIIMSIVPAWYRMGPHGEQPADPPSAEILADPNADKDLKMLCLKQIAYQRF